MDDLLNRALAQLHAHHQNEQGDQQARQIFDAAVAEGVSVVRLLPRQLKAHQGDHRGAGVRQVIEGVGRHGDGAGEHTGQKLSQRQQQIEKNTHTAGQHAVALPYRRVLYVLIVPYQMPDQKIRHICPSKSQNRF